MKLLWTKTKKVITSKFIRNLLVILIIYNAYIYTNFYFAAFHNNRIKKIFKAPQVKTPDKDDTILIVAPHPDDEVLGPGGYIRKAIKKGADVYVIMMTYGDGYKIAAETEQNFNGSPSSLIKFGEKRRLETISALKYLGVKEDHIYFLGFPDRGISHMWIYNWEKSFESPLTKVDHSPYPTSYVKNIPYNGKTLFSVLSGLIEKIKPNIVFLPSPFDFHVDHWSTYSFSIGAILYLIGKKEIAIPSIYTYLVHYRGFPYPKGYYPKGALLPPKDMEKYNTKWRSYDIEDVEMKKKDAIMRYKTQLVLLKRLLLSFVRINELWGEIPEVFIDTDISRTIPDLLRDVFIDYIDSGANIRGMNISSTENFVLITLTLQRRPSKKFVYHLRLFIPKENEYVRGLVSYNTKKGTKVDFYNDSHKYDIKVERHRNTIIFYLPYSLFKGSARFLVGCDTNIYKKPRWPYIDTTGEIILNIK